MSKMVMFAEPGNQEKVLSYAFDAPRERVYQFYSDPNLIPRWWGPRYLTTEVDRMEVKPGGSWRYIQRDDVGNLYAFNGVYHEVLPLDRITYTFEFEGEPGHIILVTILFQEEEGKTTIIERSVFQSVDDRDGLISQGMEGGSLELMERINELLVKA